MSNLSTENFQFNNQSTNLSYQAVIVIIHWLDFSWDENSAKESLLFINQKQYLPYSIRLLCPQAPTICVDFNIHGHPGP